MRRGRVVLGAACVAALAVGGCASATRTAGPHRAGPTPTRSSASASCSPGPATDPTPISDVQFVSASTGWAVAPDRIVGTRDGGRHWRVQYRAAGAGLRGIDFTDAEHGWVVGTHGLLRTADGGAHWRRLPQQCPVLRGVDFTGAADGFAVTIARPDGTGGLLLRTADGGNTWTRVDAPRNAQSVCFATATRGWLGADGHVYSTTDGGRTWRLRVVGQGPEAHGVADARVTCSRGATVAWAQLDGPGAAMNQMPQLGFRIGAKAATPLFAEQYFPHSRVRVTAHSPGTYPGPIAAISASRAVFVGACTAGCSQGAAPVDLAGPGSALTRLGDIDGLTSAASVSFAGPDDGWAAGAMTWLAGGSSADAVTAGRIVHTTDGGRTWHVQYELDGQPAPADCAAAELSTTVDQRHSGPADGVENVVLRLRNTGPAPCRLAGLPTLRATTAAGEVVTLGFRRSADPAVTQQAAAGVLVPGARGVLRLTLDIGPGGSDAGYNTCTVVGATHHVVRSHTHYTHLLITLRPGQTIRLPYPRVLTLGCPSTSGTVGLGR